ncbi:hypothetical protein BT63DRAFT_438123 [Microthyrium microscopicum]|uniref:Uncharacterized protein n=1 Tax=Microthyrium microscopicum TaxID=703497 RepID=A0A6A6UKJ8_9PEZI|nr:hypothetical protein BT63DRAFT_438123 [Microthyrium microscopicum]
MYIKRVRHVETPFRWLGSKHHAWRCMAAFLEILWWKHCFVMTLIGSNHNISINEDSQNQHEDTADMRIISQSLFWDKNRHKLGSHEMLPRAAYLLIVVTNSKTQHRLAPSNILPPLLPPVFSTRLTRKNIMADCEDGSCALPGPMTRAEKRAEYKYDPSNALETWKDLQNSLLSLGTQSLEQDAELADIEQGLHDVWDELIHIAMATPSTSAEHDRLVTLILTMRELGTFVRKNKGVLESDGEELVTMSNGQRLWVDLPFLAADLQAFWSYEAMSRTAADRLCLAVLTAKLCAAGVCSTELAHCALWLFKETLETERPIMVSSTEDHDSPITVSDLLPACLEWLDHANFKLARLCADGYTYGSGKHANSMTPGALAATAGVNQEGFSMARWLFWRRRLGELYLSDEQKVSKRARKAFDMMAETGRTMGIDIPGEKKYLDKVFEALDKEVIARGGKGCVGIEEIEIDPTWATDD